MRLLGGPPRYQSAGAAGPPSKLNSNSPPYQLGIFLSIIFTTCITNTYGGCEFPSHWSGRWFQSGVGILQMNRTSIATKGECFDSQGDKFVIYDRMDDCYRCMVIHEKHHSVLQYKETYCDQKASLAEMCYSITGDAALYSMFRKYPEPKAVPCPFKLAPFTFTYNRGSGECSNPPSRAESCTDDSRLVLKYQACPDIQSTESNIEELVCVATWKEGSTRYLVGKLNQISRRQALATDEDQYRCFIYERVAVTNGGGGGVSSSSNNNNNNNNRVTYHVAQSGDATCNGLQSAVEGSRTIQLTTADSHHGRCRFPSWITDHHTWFSLDHSRIFKFSLRNATLRITAAPGAAANIVVNNNNNGNNGNGPIVSPVAASTNRGDSIVSNQNLHLNRHHAHDATSNMETPPQKHPSSSSSGGGGSSSSSSSSTSQSSGTSGKNIDAARSSSTSNNNNNNESGQSSNIGDEGEVRVVCHSILQSIENRRVQIVAHVTAGCDSGYVCMVFHKRDASVIEIQQSEVLYENTDDACAYFNPLTTPYTTLIAPSSLHPTRCPHSGRYTVIGGGGGGGGSGGPGDHNHHHHHQQQQQQQQQQQGSSMRRKKRRQTSDVGSGISHSGPGPDLNADLNNGVLSPIECLSHDYDALAIGCGTTAHDTLEFRSPCPHQPISAYTCHGSWQENNTYYVIASPVARKSTDALRYCLVYTFDGAENITNHQQQQQQIIGNTNYYAGANVHSQTVGGGGGGGSGSIVQPASSSNDGFLGNSGSGGGGVGGVTPLPFSLQSGMIMRLSGLADSCHRHITPGSSGLWAFNFTTNGPCTRSGETGAASPSRHVPHLMLHLLLITIPLVVVTRPFR